MPVFASQIGFYEWPDSYGYTKFIIQSGRRMGCRTSSLGCKEFWPSESRDS